jgi:hypothetical protein
MNIRFRSLVVFSLLASGICLRAQPAPSSPEAGDVVEPDKLLLDPFVVTGQLDRARESIVPELGASSFNVDLEQIQTMPQGVDASFNEVLLRVPGVAQDSFGQVHLRGEHANLQYRINDVLLPEGLSGFGQELDTRFADTVSILTGALPAQYGFRTAGVVDIHTKGGALAPTRALSLYAGSFNTFKPSLESGGTTGALSYYVTASAESSAIGIENPTASPEALHDHTQQERVFAYLSQVLDAGSRFSLMLSASHARFQIPDTPGQPPAFALAGVPVFDSARLDENQREANAYAIAAYQKSTGTYDFQTAVFVRSSAVHFLPDPMGDLIFNGVASAVDRTAVSTGIEVNARWLLNAAHTLRAGFLVTSDRAVTGTATAVFPVDANGNQAGNVPLSITDNQARRGWLYGLHLQDEWKASNRLTVNFGARADGVSAQLTEGQLSPRLNVSYQLDGATTFHAGYARYFTPPPLELVKTTDLADFAGTTNAPAVTTSSPVRSERAHYFDLGLSHKFSPAFSMTLDSYLKLARNQLDEGQFGQALIFSPFNYRTGRVEGIELGTNYTKGGFAAYTNIAVSRGTGREIISGEFQFDPAELAYIATHDVALDHDQRYSLSGGVSYHRGNLLFYADALYGSGLREGFANTGVLPAYHPVNLGAERTWHLAHKRQFKLRLDVTNVFDEVYELRDGSGIGVGAPQYGARRGFYGGMNLSF